MLTLEGIREWQNSDAVRGALNHKQYEFLCLVVDRVLVECGLLAPEDTRRKSQDPLIWLLHGPPGTGKFHVLKFVKQFFALVGYTQGIDFEFTAYQAVNAKAIGGRTLHNATGCNPATRASDPVKPETAKRIAHWRWLVIDEISLM